MPDQTAASILTDIRGSEVAALVLLALPVVVLGLWPKELVDLVQGSTQVLLQLSQASKGAV